MDFWILTTCFQIVYANVMPIHNRTADITNYLKLNWSYISYCITLPRVVFMAVGFYVRCHLPNGIHSNIL